MAGAFRRDEAGIRIASPGLFYLLTPIDVHKRSAWTMFSSDKLCPKWNR
jgi:hypothetical protein